MAYLLIDYDDLDAADGEGSLFDRLEPRPARPGRAKYAGRFGAGADGVCPDCELRHPESVDCDGEPL
jgi:hypothetical protein